MVVVSPMPAEAQCLEKSVASIRWLAAPTSASWVEQVNAHPIEVLIDHAHWNARPRGQPFS